jgi:anti-anti-sigma factor
LTALRGRDAFKERVILDLGKADGIDTSGVSWLVRGSKGFEQAGGRLVLYAVPNSVRRTLELLGLIPDLEISASEQAARDLAALPRTARVP